MAAIHFDLDNVDAGTAYEAGHPYTFTVCGNVVTLRTFTVTGKTTTIRADHKLALRAEILAAHTHATGGVDMGDQHDNHVILRGLWVRGDVAAYDYLTTGVWRGRTEIDAAQHNAHYVAFIAHRKAAHSVSTVAPVVVAAIPANAAGEAAKRLAARMGFMATCATPVLAAMLPPMSAKLGQRRRYA